MEKSETFQKMLILYVKETYYDEDETIKFLIDKTNEIEKSPIKKIGYDRIKRMKEIISTIEPKGPYKPNTKLYEFIGPIILSGGARDSDYHGFNSPIGVGVTKAQLDTINLCTTTVDQEIDDGIINPIMLTEYEIAKLREIDSEEEIKNFSENLKDKPFFKKEDCQSPTAKAVGLNCEIQE
jgi:hypothetical protein